MLIFQAFSQVYTGRSLASARDAGQPSHWLACEGSENGASPKSPISATDAAKLARFDSLMLMRFSSGDCQLFAKNGSEL